MGPFRQPRESGVRFDAQAIERALLHGAALREWWQTTEQRNSYRTSFTLATTFNKPDRAIGFFDECAIGNHRVPVMGVVQEMRFEEGRGTPDPQWMQEFREFVLKYFLRVTDYREPQPFMPQRPTGSKDYEAGLSWCGREEDGRRGFGFAQHAFKLRGGAPERFPYRDRFTIVDLRDIAERFEWVALSVNVMDFKLAFSPFGSSGISVEVPVRASTNIVIGPSFVVDQPGSADGVIAELGFGYSVVPSPSGGSPVAYGPGHFDFGYQQVIFRIHKSGEVRALLAFVANRPERILQVDVAPLSWARSWLDLVSLGTAGRLMGPLNLVVDAIRVPDVDPLRSYVQLLNWLTGGIAAKQWCISWESLERQMLMQHFLEHYRMIGGSLATWHGVRDWRDAEALPRWVATGRD
jgi:hypothetical protein